VTLLRWLGWKLWYLFHRPTTLNDFVARGIRTQSPWWKFRPHVYWNELAGKYDVWLKNKGSFTVTKTINVDFFVSHEDGTLVGFSLRWYDINRAIHEEYHS
jgi:hypothetical protein